MRTYTYPPEFTYISPEQLHSAMWRLANQIHWLDAILRDDATPEPARRQRILDILGEIQAESLELANDRSITNHPLLDTHLPRLREDVAMARTAAAADPPNYVLAGAVAGACIYCHEGRAPAPAQSETGR